MKIHTSFKWLYAIIAISLPAGSLAEPLADPKPLSVSQLTKMLPDLRSGGHVIYFRHMRTEHSQEDRHPVDLQNCSAQRQLSDKGRKQARTIGRAFKRLNIPYDEVISSPYCRCKDSAQLAFGKFTTSEDLYFAMGLDKQSKQAKGKALKQMLATPPPAGKNTVIIAHTANLQEATGLWPKPEGVAYIFRPDGKGHFSLLAKIYPDTWKRLKPR